MSPPPSRRKAICLPSGENTLFQLLPSLVRATSCPVFTSTACTSLRPSCRSVYVIHTPSGEYDGRYDSPVAPLIASGAAARPSDGTSRIFGTPDVYDVTAMVFPSGDQAGSARNEPCESSELRFPVCASKSSRSEAPVTTASVVTANRFASGDSAGPLSQATEWKPLGAVTRRPVSRIDSAPPLGSFFTM